MVSYVTNEPQESGSKTGTVWYAGYPLFFYFSVFLTYDASPKS